MISRQIAPNQRCDLKTPNDNECYVYKLIAKSNNTNSGRRLTQTSETTSYPKEDSSFLPSHGKKLLQCSDTDSFCFNDGECCSNICWYTNKCRCNDNGMSCLTSNNCCTGECKNNVCGSSCFPALSTVRLADGSTKAMSSLKVGDMVLSVDESTGKLVYSEVYTMFKRDSNYRGVYLTLKLGQLDANGACDTASVVQELRVSPNHAVYRSRDGSASFSSAADLVHASKIVVGDVMWAANNGRVDATCVVGVDKEIAVGAYAPHTLVGSIVVDDVVAHSVADFQIGDSMMSDVSGVPLRWYTKGTAHMRLLYRMGLLPKSDVFIGMVQSLPIPVIHAIATVKSLFL